MKMQPDLRPFFQKKEEEKPVEYVKFVEEKTLEKVKSIPSYAPYASVINVQPYVPKSHFKDENRAKNISKMYRNSTDQQMKNIKNNQWKKTEKHS